MNHLLFLEQKTSGDMLFNCCFPRPPFQDVGEHRERVGLHLVNAVVVAAQHFCCIGSGEMGLLQGGFGSGARELSPWISDLDYLGGPSRASVLGLATLPLLLRSAASGGRSQPRLLSRDHEFDRARAHVDGAEDSRRCHGSPLACFLDFFGRRFLQCLSELDRKGWLEVMEGKEPIYMESSDLKLNEGVTNLNDTGILFVTKCMEGIEKRGLTDQGIYRIAGVGSKFNKLLMTGIDPKQVDSLDLISSESTWEVKTITSAMKQYFRYLS